MKNQFLYTVLAGGLAMGAGALRAQEPPPPPGPDAVAPGGPDTLFFANPGGRMEILGFGEMHPGKVVAGAPYIAVAVMESKQTLSDGTVIDRKTQSNIFRDGQGRTRRETTLPAVGPLAASGQPRTFIMIFDPVAGASYVLHVDKKVAEKLPAPPGGRAKLGGDVKYKFEARMQKEIADGEMKQEDLGTQTINGVAAQGTRYTHTIPVGEIGNDKAIVVTSERWYSPDLQIVVKSTRNDPRFGATTYTITSLQRQEPAATLFTVPSDYTVEQAQMKGRMKGHAGPGPGNAGAPPPQAEMLPPGE